MERFPESEGTERFLSLFHAISARWLDRAHPDPDGFHLDIIGEVCCASHSRLPPLLTACETILHPT